MSVREYIGARYVMKFADPIQHDSTTAYEPLTVVQHQGASYISKQYVPAGVDISNDDYWILMADYDAQIEQYRNEVTTFDNRITTNTNDIDSIESIIPSSSFDSTNTVKSYIDNIKTIIPSSAFDSINTVKAAIDALSAFDIEIDSRMDTAENSINNILSNYVYTFNTFTDAINADLENNMIIRTLGYENINDGGAGYYIVKNISIGYSYQVGSLYVNYIEGDCFNAACCGFVGTVSSNIVNSVMNYANSNNKTIVFPVDFTISDSIEISTCNVICYGDVTYTGTNYAFIVNNNVKHYLKFTNIVCSNGGGIKFNQTGDSFIQHFYVDGLSVTSKNYCLYLLANQRGILDCGFNISYLSCSNSTGIYGECLTGGSYPSYLGQIYFNVGRINALDCAVDLSASSNCTLTGIYFGETSFESSGNGMRLHGDGEIKTIYIQNLRTTENPSGYWFNFNGAIKDVYIRVSNPVRYDKISIETSIGYASANITIDGGIFSPSNFMFADKMMVSSRGITFKYNNALSYKISSNIGTWTFADPNNSQTWRCYKYFYVNTNNTITLKDLLYFSPLGENEIYISQNKGSGAIVKIVEGEDTIFDGSTLTETARTTYSLKYFKNYATGAQEIIVSKVS